jgi:protein associated with RNAse G/E
MPPNFQDNFLEYIDLDIDVFIDDFWRVQVLDLEEFAANILKYNYPAEIIAKAKAALDELHRLINNRDFPFNLV